MLSAPGTNWMRSWAHIIVHGVRDFAHDYAYYYLAIRRSSLSIRYVKLVAWQWRCPSVCPIKAGYHPLIAVFNQYQHVHGTAAKKWWIRKGRFTEETIDMSDWTATGRAIKSTRLSWRQWITKHKYGHMRSRHDNSEMKANRHPCMPTMLIGTPACPRCGQDEDATHAWIAMQERRCNKDMGEIHPDTPHIARWSNRTRNWTLLILLSHAYTNVTMRNHGRNLHHPTLALRKPYNFRA